jgi:acetyl/propionyl-CoA carboxylase alpha subunit
MKHPWERIAIVNHGEAAIRLIRAVRELNREQRLPLATVALFTEPDRQAIFVREADDAVCIGPATFVDRQDGQPKSSYQNRECIEEALLAAQAAAVWPGWGNQASESWLADLCERLGITFIGPGAGVLRLLSDGISARQLAQQANIPVITENERGIERAHQLEVQVIADQYGTTWAIDVRTYTLTPHGQRVLEESGSPLLPPEKERELRALAIRLCQLAGYRNAGSVEFLYDPSQHTFWFMGFNPCLSAAHPVTEVTTGLDLVKLQVEVARGARLEGEPAPPSGYAVAAHLYAEIPDHGLAPAGGKLELFRLASGPGLRLDTGYEEEDLVQAEFDPLLATLTAWGRSRQEALVRLARALAESAVIIHKGTSNKAFLLDLLERPEFAAPHVATRWPERLRTEEEHPPKQYAVVGCNRGLSCRTAPVRGRVHHERSPWTTESTPERRCPHEFSMPWAPLRIQGLSDRSPAVSSNNQRAQH